MWTGKVVLKSVSALLALQAVSYFAWAGNSSHSGDRDHDRDDSADFDRHEQRDHDTHDRNKKNDLRFVFWIEPSSQGIAGVRLSRSPLLYTADKRGRMRFEQLKDLAIGAYSDPACSQPAPGILSARVNAFLAHFGIAAYRNVVETAAGPLYLKVSARGVDPACSTQVTIGAGAPDHLLGMGGDGQSGAPGSVLPVQAKVKVLDSYGNVVNGANIAFTSASGGGSAAPAVASSDASGVAAASLKLGQAAGSNSWVAGHSGSTLRGNPSTITFTATAVGNVVATALALAGPASQQAGACSGAFTVSAVGSTGQPVNQTGALSVTIAGIGGGALFSDASCSVAATGATIPAGASSAAFYVKDTRAETLSVQASAAGLSASAAVSDTVQPGPAASLGFAQQPSPTAIAGQALAIQPTLRVLDAFGNAVTQGSVSITLAPAQDALCQSPVTGTLAAVANPVSSVSGSAAFGGVSYTLAGTVFLKASAIGLTAGCSQGIAVSPAAPSAISIVAGNNQSATVGTALGVAPQVKVTDALGNAVSGAGLAFAVTSGGGSVTPATASSDANGLASATLTLGTVPGAGGLSVTGTGTAWANPASLPSVTFSETAVAGAPAKLALSGPAGVTAGSCSQAFTISLSDSFGNATKASSALSIALSGQGRGSFYSDAACAAVISTASIAAGAGATTFYVADKTAESLSLSANGTAAGLNIGTAALTVSPAAADHLIAVAGDGQSATVGQAVAISPQVRVVDAFGNAVSGIAVGFSVASGGGSVGVTQALSDVNGLASTSFTMGAAPGSNTMIAKGAAAALPGLPAQLTFTETAMAGLPSLIIQSGPPAIGAGSCSSTFTVSLRDSLGNATQSAAGVSISLGGAGAGTFYSDATCATASSTVAIAAGSGSGNFYLKDSKAENLLLTATAPGLTGSTLPVTVQPGAAAALAFSTSPSATAVAGQALAAQPQVAVRDSLGNLVGTASGSVTLTAYSDALCSVPGTGTLAATVNPVSASAGIAAFGGVSYTLAGTVYLSASSTGLKSACSGAIQVSAGTATQLAKVQGDGQSAVVGTLLAVNPTVKARDAFGNAVSGTIVSFVVSAGGGTLGAASATTDASGQAATSYTLGVSAGSNVITASIAGGISVTFNETGTPRPPVAVLVTGPASLTAGACSAAYTVQLMDSTNSATPAASATSIALSGVGSGAFYSDAACTTAATSVAVAAGASSTQFFAKDTKAESLIYVAQATGLTSSSVAVGVVPAAASRLVYSTQPSSSGAMGQVLAAQPVVSATDAFGNLATSFVAGITLSAYSDAACTTAAAGTLSATANPLAATAGQASFAGVSFSASATIYLGASSTGLASACSSAVTLSSSMTIAAGTAQTCVLKNGNVKCWGFNGNGALGNGSNLNANTPQQVTGLTTGVLALGAGGQHVCAAVSTGLLCWGLNTSGQLGNGGTVNSNVPVAVSGITGGVTQVAGGDGHTCALVNGSVYCWGDNTNGQLGNGNNTASTIPVAVVGLPTGVQSIAAASLSTCAVINDGSAYCWGLNDFGQLGNNSTLNSNVPVKVQGVGAISQIAPGIENTCALVNGGVLCWGHNTSGQLGNGTLVDSLTPQQTVGLTSGVTKILSGGQNFSCAVLATGAVQCWGQNGRGQLGDNKVSGTLSSVPVQVVGLTSGIQVLHAGYIHACASNGTTISCWGFGTSGQLGNGANLSSAVPVGVLGY